MFCLFHIEFEKELVSFHYLKIRRLHINISIIHKVQYSTAVKHQCIGAEEMEQTLSGECVICLFPSCVQTNL